MCKGTAKNYKLVVAAIGLLGLLATVPLSAATVNYSFDLTAGGSDSNPGVSGNVISYQDTTLARTVELTSWSDGGGAALAAATGFQVSATNDASVNIAGVGVCNSVEDSCVGDDKTRSIDNAGEHDWVLLVFSQQMELSTFTVFPDVGDKNKQQGRDVTYFTGSVTSAADMVGKSYAELVSTLGMTRYDVDSGKGTTAVTVDISAQAGNTEVWGNAILIGASLANGGDRVLLTGMTTVVPVPAAVWLFVSALGALGIRRRVRA